MNRQSTNILDTLCCPYGQISASFQIFPKEGIWSKKVMYEIYRACEETQSLRDVSTPNCCEGGFAWTPTAASLHQWNNVVNRRRQPDMTVKRQLRTISPSVYVDDWRNLPSEPDFENAIPLVERHHASF
jgi:hypothetical protein